MPPSSREYEGLTVTPVTHAPTLFTQATWALARKMWDDALSIGEVAGFRNAPDRRDRADGLPHRQLAGLDRSRALRGSSGSATLTASKWQDIDVRVLTDDGEQRATKFFINGIAPTRTHQDGRRLHDPGYAEHRIKVVDRDRASSSGSASPKSARAKPSRSRWAASPAAAIVNLPPLGERPLDSPTSRRRRPAHA